MKNILFFGGSSMLAFMWSDLWKEKFNVFLGLNRRWVELEGTNSLQISNDSIDLKTILKKNQIDILINCSGLTGVEECEEKFTVANQLNGLLPGQLANIASELNIKFIHISTDHLFDGTKKMYTEKDETNPLNNYALTKLLGETQVFQNNNDAIVIRTNFFGKGPNYKSSFSDKIISSLKKNKKITLFDNVYYTPIHINEISEIVDILICNDVSGIFNISSNERITKYEFGLMIAKKLNFNPDLIIPIKIEQKKNLIIRPKDMSLSNEKIKKYTGRNISSLLNQIELIV
tara:strand:+ start:1198 stop:2064 length:867 start_codon:yes stop_codon:yes gene_type:complete